MKAVRVEGRTARAVDVEGLVLCHDLGPDLRKGTILGAANLERLRRAGELHLAVLEPGDVHEDEAARRLAGALAGPRLEVSAPVQSQVRITARVRGLLRVRPAPLEAVNRLGPISIFTLVDGQAVESGEEVAGCKVTPVAVPGELLESALETIQRGGPLLELLPFKPLRTLLVVTERLKARARQLFAEAVTRKLGWYGAQVLAVREVARTEAAVAAAYREARELDVELILFAGASAIDPLDPAYHQLEAAGGQLLHLGAPAHPGSMLWLARLRAAAVVGVASCAGFGKNTSLDLLLPFVFAYGRAEVEDLLRLGHGGLVEAGAGRRFPPYS